MSDPAESEKAIALFKRFQGRAPRGDELVELGGTEKGVVAFEVGTALSIGYKALGDGKSYYHEFEGNRPRLFVSADGTQAFFVGGQTRFTDRGFIK